MPNKTKSIGFGSPFQLPDDFVITTDRERCRGVLTPVVAENLFWSLNPPKNYYISKRKFHRIVNLQKINLFHFPAIYSVSLLSSYSQSQVNPYAGRLSQCYSWLPPCDYCQHPSLHVGRSRYKAWNHCRRASSFSTPSTHSIRPPVLLSYITLLGYLQRLRLNERWIYYYVFIFIIIINFAMNNVPSRHKIATSRRRLLVVITLFFISSQLQCKLWCI